MVDRQEAYGEKRRCNKHNKGSGRGPYVTEGITVGQQARMVRDVRIRILERRKGARVSDPIATLTLKPIQGVTTPQSRCRNGKNRQNWVDSHGWSGS